MQLIRTYYINTQSLFNKFNEIDQLLSDNNIDILCIAEHWLKEHTLKYCNFKNFVIANAFCRSNSIHGGVIIYVRELYKTKKLAHLDKLSQEIHCEICAVEITSFNIIIICIYRSPSGNINMFFNIVSQLLDMVREGNKKIFIYGDFNIDILSNTVDKTAFCDLIKSYNFDFLINDITRPKSGTCLDNCITNYKVGSNAYILDNTISDHVGIHNVIKHKIITTQISSTSVVKFRPYSEERVNNCILNLKQFNWDILYAIDEVDRQFNYFLDILLKMIGENFPLKTKTIHNKNKNKKWFNHELKNMRENITFFTELAKQNKNNENLWTYVKNLKKEYRYKIKISKKEYVTKQIINSSNKSQSIWKVINESKTHNTTTSGNTINPDDYNTFVVNTADQITSNLPIPNLDPVQITYKHINCPNVFFLAPVIEAEVDTIIKNLSNSASQDIYGMSNKLLKLIRDGIIKPLTIIINKCFEKGQFPNKLKISFIKPIYKNKGCETDMNNHRPLSIIPSLSKPVEVAFNIKLSNYLEKNRLLTDSQYGFRKNRSTINSVTKMITDIYSAFEEGQILSALLCDLSKAFDCVSHSILLEKLQCYGIRGIAHSFIESYLTNRQQITNCNGSMSSMLNVIAGVPQGSILGPLLFILYVNDISSYMKMVNTIQYADDTTFYVSDFDLTVINLNKEVAQYEALEWFTCNKLSLNVNKTKNINFTLRNVASEEDSVDLLGLHIDKKLNWKGHISILANKLSGVVFLLRKLSHSTPIIISRIAYLGIFQPLLAYGILLWGNSGE